MRNEGEECLTSNLQTLPQMRNRSEIKVEKRMGGIHDLTENIPSYEEKEKKYLSLPVTELRSTDSGFSSPAKGLMRLAIGGSPVLNHSPSISPSMNDGGFDFISYRKNPKAVIGGQEPQELKDALENSGFEVVNAPCAGYKMLLVITEEVDIFVTANKVT